MKFSEFYRCFHHSYEISHSFKLITSIAPKKCKKEGNVLELKLFGYKIFVH